MKNSEKLFTLIKIEIFFFIVIYKLFMLKSIFLNEKNNDFLPHSTYFLPPGLGNSGNHCYLNSLFQTFASSKQWILFFEKCPEENLLTNEIKKLLYKLTEKFNFNETLSTKLVRKQIELNGISVNVSKQKDFYEFYLILLESIENSLKQFSTFNYSSFSTKRIFPTHCIYEESIICPSCKSTTCSINQTSSFIIDIHTKSLIDGLHQFFGPINLDSKCNICNKSINRILKRTILFQPRSLLFFINRRTSIEEIPLDIPFEFPLNLDLSLFSLSLNENINKNDNGLLKGSLNGFSEINLLSNNNFNLTSVIVFKGIDNAGHYISYRIHKENSGLNIDRWVCCNDSYITPINLNNILNLKKNCLLLHYEI